MTVPATEPSASGSPPRQECVDAVNALWNQTLASLPGEADTAPESAVAIASGLLFIGDAIDALREEIRWATEKNAPRPGEDDEQEGTEQDLPRGGE